MPSSKPNPSILRRAFVDICRGYSVGAHQGKALYVRHLSHFSHLEYDDLQLRYKEQAIASGAPTEEHRFAQLRAKGQWSDKKDTDIVRQRDTIARFEDARRTVTLPSMQQNYDKQIADERARLEKLLRERAELLGFTAEAYAHHRLNDHYILTNVFSDAALSQPFIPEEHFGDMDDSSVESLLAAYHACIEPCDDSNLRHLAVQEFFTSYYSLCQDRLDAFFGKPVSQLSYYQVRLGNIARYFKALTEQMDMGKLEPSKRNDPEALENLYLSQKNLDKMKQEGGNLPTNMTADDMKQLGVQKDVTNVTEELSGAELVKRLLKKNAPQG